MKIVYMGTPDFAVPPLKALCAAGHDVVLAVDGHIGGDAVRDEEIGDGVLAKLVEELLLLLVAMPIALQQADNLTRILKIIGNRLKLLFLEKFRKAFFDMFAGAHFLIES